MKKLFIVLFVLFNFILCVFYIDTWRNDNTLSRAMAVHAIVEDHTLQIDPYQQKCIDISKVGDHYYSDKAPLPVFITSGVYAFARLLGARPDAEGFKSILITAGIVCGALPFLGIILLTFFMANKRAKNYYLPIVCMSAFYGSFIFCFSGTFFSHVITSFFILVSYYFIKYKRSHLLSGVFLACAFCCEYTIGLLVPIWAAQIWWNENNWKSSLKFILGIMPGVLLISIYNLSITGNPFDMLYNHLSHPDFAQQKVNFGFALPSLEAIIGLSVSSYRGMFYYAPFLVLMAMYAVYIYFVKKTKPLLFLSNYLIPFGIIFFLVISAYRMWWGGWSYGPRHLMPLVTLCLFEGVILLSSKKINSVAVFLFSILAVLITWTAKSTVVYSVPTEIKKPFSEYIFIEFFQKHFNPNNVLTQLFDVNLETANIYWLILYLFFVGILLLLFRNNRGQSMPSEPNTPIIGSA